MANCFISLSWSLSPWIYAVIAADSISSEVISEFFKITSAACKRALPDNVFSIRLVTTLSVLRLIIGRLLSAFRTASRGKHCSSSRKEDKTCSGNSVSVPSMILLVLIYSSIVHSRNRFSSFLRNDCTL